MAEQQAPRPAQGAPGTAEVRPRVPAKGGILHNPNALIIGLVVAIAAGAYFLYRRSQTAAAATAATPSTTPSTDTSGTDNSGAIGTLQTEYGDLASTLADMQGSDTDTTTTTATTVTVPNVIGDDAEAATRQLAAAGLQSTLSGPPFKAGQGTRIVEFMNPKSGAKVAKGTRVILGYKIATEKQPVRKPVTPPRRQPV